MTSPLDFYFDFASPYGYFASRKIDALAARHGRTANWHPILLGVVFKTTGAAPLPLIPLKGEYAYHDFERTARFHQIPYRRPDAFPLATQQAARAMLWVRNLHGAARAAEFARALYHAYFVDNLNIGHVDAVLALAAKAGFDAAALADALAGAPLKEQLKSEIEQAMARKVFGSPFVIADDESFWGFDHFDQLDAYLRDGFV